LDAYHQYVGGIADVTDYEQAIITLNNSKTQLSQQTESIVPAYAVLKQTMGFPPGQQFNIAFDTVQMMQEITFDTTQLLQYEKRIEYQQLQTLKKLLHQQTTYDRLSFLPSVSAIYNYYYEYENNSFPALFNSAYPYSYIGLTFNFPLFTGFSRIESVHKSKLQEQLADWDVSKLKSQIYTEYTSALAGYKSNLYNLQLLRDNEIKAKDVYRILSLQYKQGIVAFLNIIVAESNLITAETGYINALFQLLSSKIDLEKAVGIIPYNN
jgi:outer membrane protein TolC